MKQMSPGRQGCWDARLLTSAATLLVAAVLYGCTRDDPAAEWTTTSSVPVSVTASVAKSGTGMSYGIKALSLRFELPRHFGAVDDAEVVFIARSSEPRAIFSIDRAAPQDIAHKPEAGESVSRTQLGDVEAKVVSKAAVEGLPPGIAANELLVDNGPQSFSVIMSATPSDLANMWEPFIASIQVQPT